MTNKEVLELKKRFKKEDASFTRISGCYVDANRNKVTTFSEQFLTLDDEELYKYLDIAKKTLSGKVGNNILTLDMQEDTDGYKTLLSLRNSQLGNENLIDAFYDAVIERYEYTGNYLILLYHDVYDVPIKTSDNCKLDDSEETYEYIIGSICPVKLSKPGLGYREMENRIGPRIRDWVVNPPDTGFVFPAFNDRSADIHSMMFYTKDVKNPPTDFASDVLGCIGKRTAAEKKEVLEDIITCSIGDKELADEVYLEVQENINASMEEDEAEGYKEPVAVNISEFLEDCNIDESQLKRIEKAYIEEFAEDPAYKEQLLDKKTVEEGGKEKEKRLLVKSNASMRELLERAAEELEKLNNGETALSKEIRIALNS